MTNTGLSPYSCEADGHAQAVAHTRLEYLFRRVIPREKACLYFSWGENSISAANQFRLRTAFLNTSMLAAQARVLRMSSKRGVVGMGGSDFSFLLAPHSRDTQLLVLKGVL